MAWGSRRVDSLSCLSPSTPSTRQRLDGVAARVSRLHAVAQNSTEVHAIDAISDAASHQ